MEARVRLLGPPAVRASGAWVPLRPGRADAMLAFVARRGAPVRRSEVAALLWPDADARHAAANLRQTLRTLVTGPFGPLVGRDRERVWVEAASDVPGFEEALREGRWDDAVAAYRGRFLDGFELDDAREFDAWLESERAAVALGWRHACVAVIEDALARGAYAEAQRVADLVLRDDPLDEPVVRLALRACERAGDRAGVRRRFEAFQALLERDVGVAPDVETLAVARRADQVVRATPASPVRHDDEVAASAPAVRPVRAASPAIDRSGARRLIGREQALADLRVHLLDGDARLLTLLAPGGMGKTMVASAFAERHGAAFPDGVFVVDLEGLGEGADVALSVAAGTGVQLSRAAPSAPQLAEALAPQRALLVLDAFERHLGAVDLIDALLAPRGDLRVLVTSRARLRHSLETVLELGPLTTRDPSDSGVPAVGDLAAGRRRVPESSDAARLFHLVAARRLAHWNPDEDQRISVERVCAALGGTPIAIELAASWLDVMPLETVERRAREDWSLLRSDEVDRSRRHADVGALLGETWTSLDEEDRHAWARLAVLHGTLDRRVALEVAGSGWHGLRRLLERAVLRRVGDRLELHALLARFGRERARELGLEDAAWDAALAAWRERAVVEVDPTTGRYRPLEGDDLTQVAGAVRRAIARRDWTAVADLAIPVLRGLHRTSRLPERRSLVVDAIAALERGRGRERTRALARWLPHGPQRDVHEARAAFDRAVRMAESVHDDRGVAQAHEALATLHEGVAGFVHLERAHAAHVRCADDYGRASLCTGWSDRLAKLGFEDASLQRGHEALETFRRLGDLLGQATAIDAIATVDLIRGRAEPTRRRVAEARELFERSGARHMALITLATESWLCATIGDHERSLRFAEAFIEGHRVYGDTAYIASFMHVYGGNRRGDHATVLHHIPTMLAGTGAPERVAMFGQMGYECLVQAHVGLGDLPSALRDATHLVAQTAALGAPAPAAKCLSVVGQLAEALGEIEVARGLLTEAWHHPALWFANQAETRAALERLGVDPGPPCTGSLPDTGLVVARLEAALEQLERAPVTTPAPASAD
jgi:predicted ATPase/DNA-binding SARP family transcriptional activator